MTTLNATEAKTIHIAVRDGFTFTGDSHFKSFTAARRAINKLVQMGYLEVVTDKDGRTEYRPTNQAREFVETTSYFAQFSA